MNVHARSEKAQLVPKIVHFDAGRPLNLKSRLRSSTQTHTHAGTLAGPAHADQMIKHRTRKKWERPGLSWLT